MSKFSEAKLSAGAVLLTLCGAVLPACSQEGKVTSEGPDPYSQIDAKPSDKSAWFSQAFDIKGRSEKAAIALYDQIREDPMQYGPHLDEAILRAKDFEDRHVYFANGTYLPGGLEVSNSLLPHNAVEMLELAKKNYDKAKADYLRGE